jgi:hypothetical protein
MDDINKKYTRKRKYLSHRIQGSLLGAMVVLEVVLITLAMVYLYYAFNDILEKQIFLIHRIDQDKTFMLMFMTLVKTVLILSGVNVLALFIAHILWGKYVNYIISEFRNKLISIGKYDLIGTSVKIRKLHEVIDLLSEWEEVEIERCKKLHELIFTLNKQIELSASEDNHKKIQQISESIKHVLPV